MIQLHCQVIAIDDCAHRLWMNRRYDARVRGATNPPIVNNITKTIYILFNGQGVTN
jgi:hypothetical protein